jgi:hypothetical protein
VSVTSGGSQVGGLVGNNKYGSNYGDPSTIANSYATGKVNAGSGGSAVGGLVGYNDYGNINNTYATGNVTGNSSSIGGLVGANIASGYGAGSISDSYWNTTTSGQAKSAQIDGVQRTTGGLTTYQMQTASNFGGFTFSTVPGAAGNSWVMVDADGTLNNAGSAGGATYPMLTSEYSTAITNAHQLQLMEMALGASYTLAANVDASATATARANGSADVWSTAGGFVPIGRSSAPFTGSLNGSGYTISDLSIFLPSGNDVGLFGVASSSSTIQNVGLIGGSVQGSFNDIGALAGQDAGSINNSYATGAVMETTHTFGSYYSTGGLVGLSQGAVSNSYATGAVTGSGNVGGLIGESDGPVSNSYATGNVNGEQIADAVGGLVGVNRSTITRSYATGVVFGNYSAGGLVGNNYGSISNSYATGNVTGGGYGGAAGGLVGTNSGSISNSYATGNVTGGNYGAGGLVGTSSSGTVSNSFWDTTTSGLPTSAGGTGMATSDMQLQANFTSSTAANGSVNPGWDFTGTWVITGQHYPVFVGGMALIPLTITANNVTKTYNGLSFNGDSNGVAYSIAGAASDFSGTLTYSGTSQGVTGVGSGSYTITPGGLQQITPEYIVTYVNGTLTMNKLALTGSITAGNSVYGAALAPGTANFTNRVGSDVLTPVSVLVSTAGNLSSSNNLKAGSYTGSESVSALGGADAADYTFANVVGDYTVSKLALTGAIATGSSVYGAALTPGGATFSNALTNDILGAATVAVNTTGLTSTSGNLVTGTHGGIEAVTTLNGADAGNYTFAAPTGSYTVSKLALTGTIATGSSVYGAALAPGPANFTNRVGSDVLTPVSVLVSTAGNLSSSNNLKSGSYTGSESVSALGGADAADYTFANVVGDYTVSKLALTGAIGAGGSVYGVGLAPGAATFSNALTNDVLGAATVAVNTTGLTSTSGNLVAGTHGGVEAVTALNGADAGNYTFAAPTGSYTVSKLALTGAIATGSSVYGAALAPGAVSLSTAINGDAVTAGAAAVNTTNHVSTSGNLTAGTYNGSESVGSALSGADAGDYTFAGATGNYTVSPLTVSVAAIGVNKVYDGTTSNAPALSSGGVILGDQVTLADTAANFASKNVGTAQPITVSGISIGGADAADYVLSSTSATTTATISPASLTVSGVTASNKVYDGTTAATLTGGSLIGVMGGDASLVGFTDAGRFASPNAATGVAVTAAATLSGAGADNYVLVQPTGLLANITPAMLTYEANPALRTAGQPLTGLNGSLIGFVGTETQGGDTAGTIVWKTPANAGSPAGEYAIDGSGLTAANYVFVEAPANAAALTLQPAAVPTPPAPPMPPVIPSTPLPPGATITITGLQTTAQVSPAASPASLDASVTLIAAQGADGDSLGAGGGAHVGTGGSSDSNPSSWGEDPVADTERAIGTTGGLLRTVSGGVRLSK